MMRSVKGFNDGRDIHKQLPPSKAVVDKHLIVADSQCSVVAGRNLVRFERWDRL